MNIKTNLDTTFRGREYWSAVDDDSYDGPGSAIGTGHSEQEAIDDLRERLEVMPAARRAEMEAV